LATTGIYQISCQFTTMIEPWGHIEVYIVLNIIANLGHHDGNMDLQNKRLVSRSGNNAFCEY